MEKLTLEDLDNLRIEEMNAEELRELLARLEELYADWERFAELVEK